MTSDPQAAAEGGPCVDPRAPEAKGANGRSVLKSDALGRVELHAGNPPSVVRVACGGRLPGSRSVARLLLARERRALARLEGLDGVPRALDHDRPGEGRRSWIDGQPLHRAERLPRDFFAALEQLVRAMHARGVCHNDLHKEQNVLVRPDGRPALIDFQLASIHRRRGRTFASRVGDDLRHVEKHALCYERRGRPPAPGAARPRRRSLVAALWMRTGKPVYNFLTRRVLKTRDGEERRPPGGPWPEWTAPLADGSADQLDAP